MREYWDTPTRVLGVVLRPHFVRFLIGIASGDGNHPGTSSYVHHTTQPVDEPGTLIARALDRLADGRGEPACGSDLLRALLRCCLEHSAREQDRPPGKAQATWQRVQEWIAVHSHVEIDRGGAAADMGLHPTHLSDLCRRQAGTGFTRVVEADRLARARALLRARPDMTIAVVAKTCGFASAGYFTRVFRRANGQSPSAWRVGVR